MELKETFGFFLEGYISSSLKGQLISSSKFFKILRWSKLTCFLNATMPLFVLYVINLFLGYVFGVTFDIGLLWQRIQRIVWKVVTFNSLLSLTQ